MEIEVKCHKRITIGEMRETYCMQRKDHEGPCDQPITAEQFRKNVETLAGKRSPCGATNTKNGAICGLPEGHGNVHSDGSRGWSDLGRYGQ